MGTLLAPLQPTTTLIRHNIHISNPISNSNKEHLAILDIIMLTNIHTITLLTRMLHLDPIDGMKYSVDIFLLSNLIPPVDFHLYFSAFFDLEIALSYLPPFVLNLFFFPLFVYDNR
jgi:hypothetical protein